MQSFLNNLSGRASKRVKGDISLLNEQQLIESFRTGDFSETDALVRQYEDILYGLCRKLAGSGADDLYQQTWLKAVRKAHTFSGISFKNWLYTICINLYRDNYRRDKRRENVEGRRVSSEEKQYALSFATNNQSAETDSMQREESRLLLEKIGNLPDKHRLPIILHYFEGLGYRESAKVLRIPVGTVKSRLNYAKQKLRKELENDYHERY